MKYSILIVIISVFVIYTYVSIIKKLYKDTAEQHDILNKKLIFEICGWNILHIVFYFAICYIFNIQTLFGYILIVRVISFISAAMPPGNLLTH